MEGKAKREKGVLMGKTDNYKSGYVSVQEVPVYKDGEVVDRRQF